MKIGSDSQVTWQQIIYIKDLFFFLKLEPPITLHQPYLN